MTVAGGGADEMARRAAARVEDARAQLHAAEREQQAWAQGSHGERTVAAALVGTEPFGWMALHDLPWPGRQRANIDHIAVGPGGIVVIDTKNWTGPAGVRGGVLRVDRRAKRAEVSALASQLGAVAPVLEAKNRGALRAVLCVSHQDLAPQDVGQGVTALGASSLVAYLTAMPAVLSPQDVRAVVKRLRAGLPAERPAARRARARRAAELRGGLLRLGVVAAIAATLFFFPEQVMDLWLRVSGMIAGLVTDRLVPAAPVSP